MTSLGYSFIGECNMKRKSKVKKLPQAMETKIKEAQEKMTKPIEEDDEDDNYEYKEEDNEELPIVDEPAPHPSTVGADLSSFMNTPLPISLPTSPSPSLSQGNNDLLKRLNYMIHLLEEQQDHKTDRVMEEIILYGFLGVFIIFTIDSFVRVGKYTR